MKYLITRPEILYKKKGLNRYLIIPATREITGDDKGRRLKVKMVRLPYLRIFPSARAILFTPMRLCMICELTHNPIIKSMICAAIAVSTATDNICTSP